MMDSGGGIGMKTVDTKEYLDMICGLLRDGNRKVAIPVAGSSMTPFLHHGDTVYLNPVEAPLKRGDIVLYTRPSGQYILHRIVNVNPDGSYIMIGDAQTQREWIRGREEIHGIVVSALHRGKVLTSASFRWWFFEKIWLHVVPLRPLIMKSWKIIAHK